MILSFTLSMPNVGSWNGKWSGAENLYARTVNFGNSRAAFAKAQQILDKGYYHYNFGDGWAAGITVKAVDAREATRIRKHSNGFCGYEWMIDAIRQWGAILAEPPATQPSTNGGKE